MPDSTQHLDRLDRVDGSHHQSVVALGVSVVEMDAEDTAVPSGHHGSVGGLFVGVKHVREIESHPEVRRAGLSDGNQRRGHVRQQRKGPWLVRLVFNADVNCRIVVGHLANALHHEFPQARIVCLEGGVESVLTQPDGHETYAGSGSRVDARPGEIQCLAAHCGFRIAKGTELELRIRVVAHCKPVHVEPFVADDANNVDGSIREVIRVVQVELPQSPYSRGALHHLGYRWFDGTLPPIEFRR